MDSTRTSYDSVARQYADEIAGELANKPFDREFLDRFAKQVGTGPIVELGCGPGHVAAHLASRGANVSGLDLSPQMIVQAKRLSPGLDFVVGDMLALPFADASLAGIVSFYSIVNFDTEQTQRAFAQIARVLAPGGLLALAFHVGRDTVHRDEWFGEPVNIDFSSHEPDVIVCQLAEAGLVVNSQQERDPYPPAVEFQSRRCYIVASRG